MKRTLGIMILLVASVLIIQTAYASSYQKIDLGTLGGNDSRARGVNNNGQIVGSSQTNSGAHHAFLWENSSMTDLGTLGRGEFSVAYGTNDKGQIVGESDKGTVDCVDLERAFLWENGLMTDLGTLGGYFSYAHGINDKGQIVGYSNNESSYYEHAFVLENGSMIDLGTLGGYYSWANGINNNGQIVGSSQTNSGAHHAFLWENGSMIDLGTLPGGNSSWANGINDKGQIVGYSETNSGAHHAFLWENGSMIDLGTLPGGNSSWANGINDKGQIVGYSEIKLVYSHAFLWENGSMIDLGTLPGGNSSWANGINDKGQIVGDSEVGKIIVGYIYAHHAILWTVPPIICSVNVTNYQHYGWGQYPVITNFNTCGVPNCDEQDVPLFSDGDPIWMSHVDRLAKLVIDNDDSYTLKAGKKVDLGKGYALEVKQVDIDGKKVWLELTKDGKFVDDQIVSTDSGNHTWTYKQTVQGVPNVPVLKVHVYQVFQGAVDSIVQIDGVWLIDYANATTLNVGDQIGDYQLEKIHNGTGPCDPGYLIFEFN